MRILANFQFGKHAVVALEKEVEKEGEENNSNGVALNLYAKNDTQVIGCDKPISPIGIYAYDLDEEAKLLDEGSALMAQPQLQHTLGTVQILLPPGLAKCREEVVVKVEVLV